MRCARRTPAIAGVVHQHPATLPVVDDAAPHAASLLDDRVILPGIGRIGESHHEFVRARVYRAVDPVGGDVAERARSDLDRADLALRQIENTRLRPLSPQYISGRFALACMRPRVR